MQVIEWNGYPITSTSLEEAVQYVIQLSTSDTFQWVTTLNPQIVMMADSDPTLKTFLQQSALIVPDGEGIVQVIRQDHAIFMEKIPGVELAQKLCETTCRIYCLGAEKTVIDRAVQTIQAGDYACEIVGHHDGYFDRAAWQEILRDIQSVSPDIILVGMGCPKQESVLMALAQTLRSGVGIGVGGSFDVLSGIRRRAPKWVQNCRLEWLYRCVLQPKKWSQFKTLWGFYQAYIRPSNSRKSH